MPKWTKLEISDAVVEDYGESGHVLVELSRALTAAEQVRLVENQASRGLNGIRIAPTANGIGFETGVDINGDPIPRRVPAGTMLRFSTVNLGALEQLEEVQRALDDLNHAFEPTWVKAEREDQTRDQENKMVNEAMRNWISKNRERE